MRGIIWIREPSGRETTWTMEPPERRSNRTEEQCGRVGFPDRKPTCLGGSSGRGSHLSMENVQFIWSGRLRLKKTFEKCTKKTCEKTNAPAPEQRGACSFLGRWKRRLAWWWVEASMWSLEATMASTPGPPHQNVLVTSHCRPCLTVSSSNILSERLNA